MHYFLEKSVNIVAALRIPLQSHSWPPAAGAPLIRRFVSYPFILLQLIKSERIQR